MNYLQLGGFFHGIEIFGFIFLFSINAYICVILFLSIPDVLARYR